MSSIKINRNHVPYVDEKMKLFIRSKSKLQKIVKRQKTNNQLNNYIKNDLNDFFKNNSKIDYYFALEFILFFSNNYVEIERKVKEGALNTDKIKNETFWINPSKDLVIFFTYTFLFELYHDHLVPHLAYMEKLTPVEIIKEVNKYKA